MREQPLGMGIGMRVNEGQLGDNLYDCKRSLLHDANGKKSSSSCSANAVTQRSNRSQPAPESTD
eukprot:12288134-Ditylum_brightwellii.AAC.1